MIDGSVDPDFAALERSGSLKPNAAPPVSRVRRGVLADLPAHPPAFGTLDLGDAAVATVAAEGPGSATDPTEHLQTARLGFAAAVVLVLCWLWIRNRRKVSSAR